MEPERNPAFLKVGPKDRKEASSAAAESERTPGDDLLKSFGLDQRTETGVRLLSGFKRTSAVNGESLCLSDNRRRFSLNVRE